MFRRTKEFCQDRLNDMLLRSGDGVGGSEERQDYRNSELRQYWMPDAYSLECYDCNLRFNTFRRKHHCRVCGQIFCSSCSSEYIDGKSLGFNGKLRVCKFCFDFFLRFLKGLEPGASPRLLEDQPSRESTPSSSLNQSAFYSLGSPFLEEEHQYQYSDAIQFSLKDPTQLGRLWAKIVDNETGIHLSSVDGKFSGMDLVRWLTSRDESMGPEQAVAIGQALLDARYMMDELGSKEFTSSDTLYKSVKKSVFDLEDSLIINSNESENDCPEWLQNIPVCKPEGQDATERKISGSSNTTLNLSNEANANGKLLSESVLDNITLSNVKENSSNDGSFRPTQSHPNEGDSYSLDSIYSKHIGLLLKHLMAEEMLHPQWYNIILLFAEKAVEYVKLNHISRNDNVDVRKYISVKKIPYGNREKDCRIFPGIMFQNRPYCGKNRISNARILLVRGSISFNRVKYASLENFISQEDEYLKNICSKIKSFKPDVIFVEKTITYQAKLILSSAGIAIVQNVKLDLLEKISRHFGSPILTSLDSIPNQPDLGSCESYKVQSFVIKKDFISPDFVILESRSKEKLGCTIILRGASKTTLSKVKRLIKHIALCINNKYYEKSFLQNEFVRLNAHNNCTMEMIDDYPLNFLPMSPFLCFSKSNNASKREIGSWEYEDEEDITESEPATSSSYDQTSDLNLINTSEGNWAEMLANFRAGVSDRPLSDVDGGPKIYNLSSKFSKPLPPSYYSNPKPLPVLFSSYSPRSKVFPSYCIAPCIVDINFYGVNDLPLGIFLETFCFAETSYCPNKGCNASITDHIRRFCLDDGVINLYIQPLVNPIHQNSNTEGNPPIVTWKYCVECEKLGPVVELTESSWNYSFGMFLSLLIYEDKLVGGGSKQVCSHSLHQQHYTCFSRGYLVVSFKFSKVKPFLTALPPNKIQIHPYLPSILSMTVEVREIATNGTLLFSKIHEKLNDLETKETTSSLCDKHAELTNKYEDNYKEFRSNIDYVKSLIEKLENPDIKDEDLARYSLSARRQITGMKQYLSDKLSTWKLKLSSFVEEKKKEEKVSDRSRSLSGNNSGNSLMGLDHADEVFNRVGGEESSGYASATTRIWQNFSSSSSEVLLPNIFPSHVHYGLDSHNYIVVDEKQPSSIVAHVLSTGNYLEKRRNQMAISSNKNSSPHCDCEFSDKDNAQFYCNAYFAWEFEKLRNEILINPKDYVQSLAECAPWKSSGGKSGLHFYKTKDDRFILKEMSSVEFNCFQEFAPQYFDYIRSALNPKEKKPSVLAKILGIYKIGSKNSATKETHKMDFLVIENVFYGRDIVEKYDLKGSMRNRLVDTKIPVEGGNLVLMDENLLKISCDRPIFIRKSCQENLLHAIDRDTTFLQNAMVMDYSLLVGIDSKNQELVLGIIDYIRNFSWDKKLENLIKKSGLLGGKPGTTPTIIPPKIYKKRFIEAMLKYFIVLPEYASRDP